MSTETFSIHWNRGQRGERTLVEGLAAEESSLTPSPRIPARVARLVALAHRLDVLVRSGVVRDLAHAARLAGITRARASQVADLGLLAPTIQEELLFLLKPDSGREHITERHLRRIVREPDWTRQHALWASLKARLFTTTD